MNFQEADTALARTFNAYAGRSSRTDTALVALASWSPYVLAAVPALLLLFPNAVSGYHPILFVYGGAIFARFFIAELFYYFIPRRRPSAADGITPIVHVRQSSFPSGHATFFFALAGGLLMIDMPYAHVYGLCTAVMCFSRVVAGAHYPSDILAGAVLGVSTMWACLTIAGV